MLPICAVLVAVGVVLFFFPDTALVLSDHVSAIAPGNVHLGSAVAWLAKHPLIGLMCFAVGLLVIVKRLDRWLVNK
jgi:hypothetical protein